MFRRWISNFFAKHKEKIQEVCKIIMIVALVIYVFYICVTKLKFNFSSESNKKEIYKPTETLIQGSDISEEEYAKDSNLVEIFVNYCNEGSADKAYSLLSDDCKKNIYPTLEDFKRLYYNEVFAEKREYNIQSWISQNKKNTYRLRITDDLLATGNYTESVKYDDYITIIEQDGEAKLSIHKYVCEEEINKKTETNELEINVVKKDVFIDYEIYTLVIKNKTQKSIKLDTLSDLKNNIILLASNGSEYKVNTTEINENSLIVKPSNEVTLKLQFSKSYISSTKAKHIEFKDVVLNTNSSQENVEKTAITVDV